MASKKLNHNNRLNQTAGSLVALLGKVTGAAGYPERWATRKMMKILTFAIVLLLVGVVSHPAHSDCLDYEPSVVTLQGTLIKRTLPGPPEYESVENGDKPETYYFLLLKKPICVTGDPKSDINTQSEANISEVQIVPHRSLTPALLEKIITISGALFHSHTGHHRVPILIEVKQVVSGKTIVPNEAVHRIAEKIGSR